MKKNKVKEVEAVKATIEAAGLEPRLTGGRFEFLSKPSGSHELTMEMIWDGAGYNKEKELILIEAELCNPLNKGHLQQHLTRLLVMKAAGLDVTKLIWIIYNTCSRQLYEIVCLWKHMLGKMSHIGLPEMEIRNPNGEIISWWNYGHEFRRYL